MFTDTIVIIHKFTIGKYNMYTPSICFVMHDPAGRKTELNSQT